MHLKSETQASILTIPSSYKKIFEEKKNDQVTGKLKVTIHLINRKTKLRNMLHFLKLILKFLLMLMKRKIILI